MKFSCIILLTFFLLASISNGQDINVRHKVLVGDSKLVASGEFKDDPYCGKVHLHWYNRLYFDYSTILTYNSGIQYKIYFTPSKPGIFHENFTYNVWYDVAGSYCSLQLGGTDSIVLEYQAVDSSTSTIMPNSASVISQIDTTGSNYSGAFSLNYRNKNKDTVKVTNIKYVGENNKNTRLSYADGSDITTEHIILPYIENTAFSLRLTSTEGPFDCDLSRTSYLIIEKTINSEPEEDTVFLSMYYKSFCFVKQVSISDRDLYVDINKGDSVDVSVAFDYTSKIDSFYFPAVSPSSLINLIGEKDSSGHKQLIFRCYSDTNATNYEVEYKFKYYIRLFDSSLVEVELPEYNYKYSLNFFVKIIEPSIVNKVVNPPLKVFPNPTSNGVTILYPESTTQEIRYVFKDMLGRIVLHDNVKTNGNSIYINLDKLVFVNSFYFLTCYIDDEIYTEKITVLMK